MAVKMIISFFIIYLSIWPHYLENEEMRGQKSSDIENWEERDSEDLVD